MANIAQKFESNNEIIDITGLEVQGYNLVVQPFEAEQKITTENGMQLFLPDSFRDDVTYLSNVCRVLAVGPTAYTQEMFQGKPWCKVGDYVIIPKNTGQKILWKKKQVTIVACDRVIAVVDDPAHIDQSFNLA